MSIMPTPSGMLWSDRQAEPKPQPIARSRGGDPDTSHQAARHANRTGTAATQLAAVVRAVTEHPGRTSGELDNLLPGMDLQAVRRRLVDAKRFRHVLAGQARQCRVLGSRQTTWNPNPDAPTGTRLDVTA